MKQLLIKVLHQGKVVQSIDMATQSFKIKAMPNAEYLVVDKTTGHAPVNVKVKREGTDLRLQADDASPSLIIENYYNTEHIALVGDSNGKLYAYDTLSSSQVSDLANLGSEPVHHAGWQAGKAMGNSNLAMIGLGVLGVAGIATAASGSNSASHDKPTPSTPTNHAPTAIVLDNITVAENATGAVIGKLTTIDQDTTDTFTYMVSDNRFEVGNGQLKLKAGIALDYEAAPTVALEVTSTDQGGLATKQLFNITVTDVNDEPGPMIPYENHAPTGIILDNVSVTETMAGKVIGKLSTTDPDFGNTFTYSVSDNRFEVVNGQLKLKGDVFLNYETEPTVTVKVTSTDQGGLATSRDFIITVSDMDETGYIYGDNNNNVMGGTNDTDILLGLKGNDILNGGLGADGYVFYKGDGNDVINEENLYNVIEFNDVNSQDITVDRYKENITVHYTNNDSVTFNVNTVQQIVFKDTVWKDDDLTDKLGVPYWDKALTFTNFDVTYAADINNDKIIYFSFPTVNPRPEDTSMQGWAAFTEEQKALARETFHNLEAFLPIKFVEVATNTVQPDVIYLQNNTKADVGVLGLGGPNGQGGGNIWLSSPKITDIRDTQYTIAHEIGHVLGLDHPVNYDNDPYKLYELNDKENTDLWTLMTYNQIDSPIPTNFQELDIASLQYLYGVNPNSRTGNENYGFSSKEGTFVWDGAGIDTINASNATQSAYIDLHDGSWSYIGKKSDYISSANQLTINSSTKIENAIGGLANDTLIGNELGNVLQGNGGNDTITGYQSADTIVFTSLLANNTGGNGHDTFTDFHVGNTATDSQADKIDLSQLLVGYTGDHSASSLIGFIEVTQQYGNSVISIDRDGAGTAFVKAELLTLNATSLNLDQLIANNQIVL